MRYLIYTPPVIRFFHHCMRSSYPRGFLFSTGEDTWHPERLSAAIKSHTKRTLGFSIRHRQWRHIAIALDRRLLQGVGYQVYGIASDLRGNPEDILDSNLDGDQNTSAYPPLHLRGAAKGLAAIFDNSSRHGQLLNRVLRIFLVLLLPLETAYNGIPFVY